MDKGKKVCDFCKNEITDLMSIHFGDFDYCSLDCALEDKDRKEVYNYLQKIDSRIVNYLEGQKKRKNDKLF